MSGYDDEYEDEDSSPKGLRDALKAEKQARKDAERKLDEVLKRDRQRTVADVLKSKGVKPALARFVLADLDGDVDEKQVNKWLEENGEIFGVSESVEEPDNTSDEEVAEAARMASAEKGGTTASAEEDLNAAIAATNNQEELNKILVANGLM